MVDFIFDAKFRHLFGYTISSILSTLLIWTLAILKGTERLKTRERVNKGMYTTLNNATLCFYIRTDQLLLQLLPDESIMSDIGWQNSF